MQASPARIIEYFNGEKQNLIPLFQRPYTWEEKQWQVLWDDLLLQHDLGNKAAHFMGAVVSIPAHSVPVGVSKHLIIDGQQRLTTIAILLCALRDSLGSNESQRIQEVYLINRFREPEDTLKLLPTQADRDAYRDLIFDKKLADDESRVVNAYRFFLNKLKAESEDEDQSIPASEILSTLENNLQVVMINLGDGDDPYLIFESLNFKGQPLTQADLVRNFILMKFRHSVGFGGEQERIYQNYWHPLEKQLDENLTEFLRHFAMKAGENIKQGGIYAATKTRLKNFDTPEQIEAEVLEMKCFGEIYASFLEPSLEPSPSIRQRLSHLKELDVKTSYPLLLRLFNARKNDELSEVELEKCLCLIESLFVRRAVCSILTNPLNKMFLQWCKNFPDRDHLSWLSRAIIQGIRTSRFPDDEEFAHFFKYGVQYKRASTDFVLRRLEQSHNHKEPGDLSSATIEHVMPQTLSEPWVAFLGQEAEQIHKKWKDTFGNLTLSGYNSEMGNQGFEVKKAILKNSHFEMNQWIVKQETWGAEQIEARAAALFVIARELWPAPATA